jgi:hypothetical protein
MLRRLGRFSQGVLNDQNGLSALRAAGLGWEGVSVPHRRIPKAHYFFLGIHSLGGFFAASAFRSGRGGGAGRGAGEGASCW